MIVEERLDDGNGIVAVDEIIRQQPIPRLFVTGDVSRVTALEPDAVVIQKPFAESALSLAIKRALEAAVARPSGTRLGQAVSAFPLNVISHDSVAILDRAW